MTPTIPARCRHLHTDGRQCGSPALRAQPLCYQHTAARQPLPTKTLDDRTIPQLPAPDDFPAIARSIAEVLRLAAEEEITDRRAATLLRGLALASQNLARGLREARRQQAESPSEPVTDLVNHPELGPLALAATPQPQPTIQPQHQPEPHTVGVISIQQNQDLSPLHDVFSEPSAHPEEKLEHREAEPEQAEPEQAAPTPAHRFTAGSGATAADEEHVGLVYMQLQASFRDQRRAFIHEKTTELEAQFQQKLEQAIAERLQELQQAAARKEAAPTQQEAQPAAA